MKIDNYGIGDCFEFKESIKDFGVVFLEEKIYPDGKQFNLFPVKFDTTKTGLDKFKYGKVYLTSFTDFTKPSGRTQGFVVYHFLNQKNFDTLNNYFKQVGTISIKDEFKNATGGTIATSLDDFKIQLNIWDKMFGSNGQLTSVKNIIQQ